MKPVAITSEIDVADAQRRRLLDERKSGSGLWQLIHILGSLKLALALLAILAVACAIATFTEANFNTKIAQATIYHAPWFIFWLALLCVNLFAVTLTRWPWERKHFGFVITHYGIITLLIGALIGSTWGFEGNVVLRTDAASPTDRIIVNRNALQVESPTDGHVYRRLFDVEATPPSSNHPRRFPIPGSPLTIVANKMSSSLRNEPELRSSAVSGAPPGILLELSSSVSAAPIRISLLLDSKNSENQFFGLARIQFVTKLPERLPHTISETRMVFSHHPPVIQALEGSTGYQVELNTNGTHLTLTDPVGKSRTLEVSKLLGHSIQVASSTISLEAFWPDFEMHAGRPVSASPFPRNPAILIRIAGPSHDGTSRPLLEIAPNPDDPQYPLQYQLSRGGVVYAIGKLAKESSFATGWADWKAKLLDFLPSASLATRLIPFPQGPGITGFQAFLQSRDGTKGPTEWIGPGTVTTLFHRDGFVRLTYGYEIQPLPFTIKLNSFTVPRYEGTETPSNYISKLVFQDTKNSTHKEAVSKMNHPASFPGGWWASLTGLNYKFSQAQWNPGDLRETTLQILYDPGWLLKWIGSLSICVGIAIMFYFTSKRS